LDYLVGIAVGFILAWFLRRGGTISGARPGQEARPPASEQPAGSAASEAAEPLATRLQKLEPLIDQEATASAHPRDLTAQPNFVEAMSLLADPSVALETVRDYALGGNWILSSAALAALCQRADGPGAADSIAAFFDNLSPWAMHFALRYFLTLPSRPPAGAPLVNAKEWWRENIFIPALLRDYFAERQRLGDAAVFGPAIEAVHPAQRAVIAALLARVQHPMAEELVRSLEAVQRSSIDRAFLTSFGRFWSASHGFDLLVEPEPWRDALEAAEATVRGASARSVMASGEPRVGKTSFLRLVAARLARGGWSVFEAGGADLMAGQQWFGQLEGRIQHAIEELAASKKVIWYIPDLLQIAMSGTHQGQAASILDQILPAVAAGRLIVWTEATTAATSRLLRLRPALRSTFELFRMEPLDQAETRALADAFVQRVSQTARVAVDPGAVEVALASASQYLSASSLPGSALDLLKLTLRRLAKGREARIEAHDVILTLSQLTGLPASILDTKEGVDLASVRAFFAARVIGQNEAVQAVVERIAMLKAGLNDPGKPIGVFLFAGPTGTGKTELAKTLAEFLFGSVDRMIRLDMSEFQTAESTAKILGSGDASGPADSLITLVRKQPFSVVLLDEFEKAHANIWDLFLQVFDDGRLTDHLGQVADFRHTIIILTTNLGATSHRNAGLGFSPSKHAYSSDQVLRAVSQTFRPEFQNRLDKVIVFRELSRDLMRGILKKELSRVLERRGLKDREWAVEWEASALEFLLEKGFSPEMGARPLKRAIDQYVIAPLAATIVEKRFPEGDQFVFVRSDGHAIQAEFVDPDTDTTPRRDAATHAGEGPALPAMILAPDGSEAELEALAALGDSIGETLGSARWEELKESLAAKMMDADFWNNPERHEVLSRLALMDRVKAAAGTAQSLRARLDKGLERAGKSSRELVARLALQLHLVNEGIRDVLEAAPIEVAVAVEPTLEKPGEAEAVEAWCAQLRAMYRAWADNRHMPFSELESERGTLPPVLLVSGFGAYRVLARESGLHVLELADDDGSSSRVAARVRAVAAPAEELQPAKLRRALHEALSRAGASSTVVRRYRREPAPLVRDMSGGWRSGRLDQVLGGDFDLIAAMQG
jgi:ATP-dependent Clp protease ATP-binding subunit ClpC